MSVAFRRESDEEHLEPKFEVPIPAGPNLVTPRGLALIRAEAERFEAAAAAEPDPEKKKALLRDWRYWSTRLATAEIAPPPAEGEAGIGSVVTIRFNGAERSVHITGHDEADPAHDRIAFAAPLARALIGAIAGEAVDYGGKEGAIELLDVRTADEKATAPPRPKVKKAKK